MQVTPRRAALGRKDLEAAGCERDTANCVTSPPPPGKETTPARAQIPMKAYIFNVTPRE